MGEKLEAILRGLNEAQREAVLSTRGALVILAGAGTGKTTTVTRRIAAQVATEAFEPRQLLALTFSAKAAAELRGRLAGLDVSGVRAVTFHAEALAQFRRFVDGNSQILSSKAQILHGLSKRLPRPHIFTPLRELATEIEWAKNRRVGPKDYLEAISGHEPPIPAEHMHKIFIGYEKEKRRRNVLDFEDLLERVLRHLSENDRDLGVVRSRYSAFTVDEYQDVNLLQQSLLEAWLGRRDEVCVVGDDHQSIYGFTGASPRYLQTFEERYPNARVVTLRENHRSTPQVIEVANMLAPRLSSKRRSLVATKPDGPAATFAVFEKGEDEVAAAVATISEEIRHGTAPAEIAILLRINARTEPYEEALAQARIPYQVRDGAFLTRPAAKSFMARVRRLPADADVASSVAAVTEELGFTTDRADLPDEERSRQEDLERLRLLAESSTAEGVAGFVEELAARFSSEEDAHGVQLLTLHRSKGLEFDVVLIPELEEGLLPISHAKSEEAILEERRLLYVGITRAKRRLIVSRSTSRSSGRTSRPRASRFWRELQPVARVEEKAPRARAGSKAGIDREDPRFGALRAWRSERAKTQGVPAYIVFPDSTLAEIASRMPASRDELRSISGVGPMKLSRYGDDVLAVLTTLRETG